MPPKNDIERRNQALEALHDISLELNSKLETGQLLKMIIQHAVQLIEADAGGCIYLYEKEFVNLQMVEAIGYPEKNLERILAPGEGLTGKAFVEQRSMRVDNYQQWTGNTARYHDKDIMALLVIPLQWQDDVLGTFNFYSSRPDQAFSDEDQWLAEMFAVQAATAIQNNRLYRAQVEANTKAASLHKATLTLSSILSLDEVLKLILEQMHEIVPYTSGSIIVIEGGIPSRVMLTGFDDHDNDTIETIKTVIRQGKLVHQIIEQRLPLIIPDVTQNPDWKQIPVVRKIRSWMGIPLILRDELLGILMLDHEEPNAYSGHHFEMAWMLSVHAAIAIENASLYEEARHTQKRFEDIALSTSDWLWEMDGTGRLTYCSQRVVHTLGYEIHELLGTSFYDYISPRGADLVRIVMQKDLRQTINFESAFRHKEGHYITLSVTSTPVLDQEMEVIGYRGTARDVTSLRQAQQRDQLAYELGQQLLSVLSLKDVLDFTTSQVQQTLGYYHTHIFLLDQTGTKLEVASSTIPLSRSSDEKPFILYLNMKPSNVARAARTLEMVVSNNVHHDQNFLPNPFLPDISSEAALPLFRGDRTLGVLVVNSTEKDRFTSPELRMFQNLAVQLSIAIENARLYEALEQQANHLEDLVVERTAEIVRERERMNAIVHNAGEGIIFTDVRGIIEYANPAWERTSGYTLAELEGKDILVVLRAENREDVRKDVWDTIRKPEIWEGEFHPQRRNGSEFVCIMTIAPVFGSDGKISNVVGVLHDITAQKEIEEMRAKFIANVSHELRTPITNLKLYHMLLESGSDEKRTFYLQTVDNELRRLERLVEDLLDISTIDRGEMKIFPVKLNINDLVKDIVETYQPRADVRGHQLVTSLTTSPLMVEADRERMIQALANLLMNAINYTGPDTIIELQTKVVQQNADQPVAAVVVKDNGQGIAAMDLPFIFDRFFRAEAAAATGTPGTGLGLSIVKEIIELHHGSITAESKKGEGTAFTIHLPVASG